MQERIYKEALNKNYNTFIRSSSTNYEYIKTQDKNNMVRSSSTIEIDTITK